MCKTIVILCGLAMAALSAHANVIQTYTFSGKLATLVNGSDSVTGQFTLDLTAASIVDYSFTTPIGPFPAPFGDFSHLVQFDAIVPNAHVVELEFGHISHDLVLLFQTDLATFPGTFLPGVITVSNGLNRSRLVCDISVPVCPPSGVSASFSEGNAVPLTTGNTTPEPAGILLVAAGLFTGLIRARRVVENS